MVDKIDELSISISNVTHPYEFCLFNNLNLLKYCCLFYIFFLTIYDNGREGGRVGPRWSIYENRKAKIGDQEKWDTKSKYTW